MRSPVSTPGESRGPSGAAPRIVCKIGGSLLDAGLAPPLVARLRRASPGRGILALAGGGAAADRVRRRHRAGELDASSAHWAAIRTMDGNALRLAGGCGPRLPLVTGAAGPGARGWPPAGRWRRAGGGDAGGGLAVLAPSPLLRAEDPLPHGWHVTGDSIAAWIAGHLGASRLVLLKARGRVSPKSPGRTGSDAPTLRAARAAGDGLVDAHLPSLVADAAFGTWIVDGRHPDRLLSHLAGDEGAAIRLAP